ncbi:hypothetical protein [Enhygromyxa salina]|uniref:Uncharacterized protein n=1 Tax=Enhygromyxa salina TaxID=215803 RepID=A0A2S9Y677_9BACT|nr:hypothetical protein [Enhygromyxa salina]PRQ00592.1 hypothetical protein ENSA7_60870 [Enhygromyxa salina]
MAPAKQLIEGQGVVRLLYVTLHNSGGSPNTSFIPMGWPKP